MCGTLLRHTKHKRLTLIFAALALPLTLYSPYMIYILALFALTSMVLSFLLFASPVTVMAYILLVVSGATISVLFPLTIALAGLKYPEMSGMVMGIIILTKVLHFYAYFVIPTTYITTLR